MSRITIDIDDKACVAIMRCYGFVTKQEAVNFALRSLVVEPASAEPLSLEEIRRLRGSGWDGNLDEMRTDRLQ